MIYGRDKAIEMARSLLPSTKRKGARDDKANIKRASRHNIRTELHRATIDPDYYDDSSTDFDEDTNHEIRYVVRDRRGGDKTAPFERWSEAITKNVDRDSRLTYVKSLLPEGVIGDHALTHIEWKEHFRSAAKKQLEENIELNALERRNKNRMTREDELKALRKIVEDGRLHRELNGFVTSNSSYSPATTTESFRVFNEETQKWERKYKTIYLPYPPGKERKFTGKRKLLGMHDIEIYLDDIKKYQPERLYINKKWYSNPDYCGNMYGALQVFLTAVHENKPAPRGFRTELYQPRYW